MSRLTSSLVAALVAGLLTTGILYFNQRTRAREAAHLQAANARLRLESTQRHEAQLTRSAAASAPVSTLPPPVERKPAAPPPSGDYRNEGQSSPVAVLQTFAWACDRGDTETIKSLLCFETAGRTKAEAFMATLPPDVRAHWNSPEAMAAELLTHQGMQQPFPASNILERAVPESAPDGRVVLHLPGTAKDGTVYQKIGDRWHYVITEAAVDRYIAERSRAAQR